MSQQKIDFEIQKAIIVVPACIKMGRKNYYLNLNTYSNWHGIVRNNVKKKFTKAIFHKLMLLPKMSKIHSLTYTLIITSKRKRDRMNVYSIVDKFFCDALQEYGKIEDDSDEFINEFNFTKTEYHKGAQDQLRVRIDIYYETK
jgi:hypothetical protein